MSISVGKTELRNNLKKLRTGFSREQVTASSLQVSRNILACDAYRKAKCIMGYLAFGNELSIDLVLSQALADGKIVAVPHIISSVDMISVHLRNMDDFDLDRYGIRSIRCPFEKVLPQTLDLILVPGVAFGIDGSRLGMGAGYYDRFLPQADKALFMGIAYDQLIQSQLPADNYDIFMQCLASESGITTLSRFN